MSSLRARLRARLWGPGAWRAWLGMALFLALFGYALFAILWRELPRLDLRELFSRVSAGDVALALVVYSADLALAIGGWAIILGVLSGLWHPLDHFRIYTLTAITRRLPGTFWYLLGRVVLYERLGIARAITAVAGAFEFAATALGGVLVAIVTWPLALASQQISPAWLAVPVLLCAALLNPPAVRGIVRRLSPDHHTPPVSYRTLLAWVLLYALVWAVGGVLLFVTVRAIHPLPAAHLPAMIGVWSAAGLVSMLLGSFVPFGLGVTEVTLATLLTPFMPASEALFVALLMRALLTLCELGYGLVGGLLCLPDLLRRSPVPDEGRPLVDAEKPDEVAGAGAVVPPKEMA
ncbi:MAG: hypothetical protein OHK0015_16840 [Chloroflexi bacterium OHK40]